MWQAAERENFVPDVQKMRRRVVDNIPVAEVDRELKLGPGGLRDVEFAVQLLQLVHGRSDATLRSGTTLDALQALAAGGYVGRADAAQLDDAYRFLRAMEHRIQLYRLRRTHLVPEDEADLRRLGRSLGLRTDPVAELNKEWRRHAAVVRRLHEKLFYRPLLDAVAQLDARRDPAQPEGGAGSGWRRSATPTRPPRCATWRRWPPGSAARPRSSAPCCPCCWAGSPTPPTRTPGCSASARSPTRSARRPGTCGCCATRAPPRENLARVLSAGRLAPDLLLRAPEAVALLGDRRRG